MYSSAGIVNVMLGWLKALATWVLRLFNLAGGASPLEWFSRHWLGLLVILMLIGIVGDFVVWMVRWRPYWEWFKRKRVIVNDERMLSGEKHYRTDDEDDGLDREYLVPTKIAERRRTPSDADTIRPIGSRRRVRVTEGGQRAFSRGAEDDDLFEVAKDRDDYSDFSEDEVFNVSSLSAERRQRSKRKRKR
ncbi:MAG: hypothetical protein E7317_02660 [Clostridiales bacterium]|nr:hypothetical protein [Clostridiales bacterium]